MKRLLLTLLLLAFTASSAAIDYKIVTATERGTYIQIGRDLAKFVAPDADINLDSVPSTGATENVRRLRYEPGVKFALMQSDVMQAFLDAAPGNSEARNLIRHLRLIAPLYNEEIYFIARADAPFDYLHEVEGKKISLGALGSGGALTAATLYQQMFNTAIPNPQFMSNDEGLSKLVGDKTVDIVVIVAGQPAKVITDMQPQAKELVKILKFDEKHPTSANVLKTYFKGHITATSYPNLLTEDIPSIAVKAFLTTFDFEQPTNRHHLARFGTSLCENFGKLQAAGHPKWKEVTLALPDAGAWTYYRHTTAAIKACQAKQTPLKGGCQQQDRILGLCGR